MVGAIDDLATLQPGQRVERYRKFAKDAEISAGNALTPHSAASYLILAEQWRALADEVESQIHPPAAKSVHWRIVPSN